jgi:hypothetical protein
MRPIKLCLGMLIVLSGCEVHMHLETKTLDRPVLTAVGKQDLCHWDCTQTTRGISK